MIPDKYRWLETVSPPHVISEGLRLYGIKEQPGPSNAPQIMGWARQLDLADDYVADAVPWCGLFVAYVTFKADWPVVRSPLWARNWLKFGNPAPIPSLGDVLVYQRAAGGHVGFYIAEDKTAYHTLGGNQGDQVSIVRIAKTRLLGARRCPWKTKQPDSVKPYYISTGGSISTNEG